MAVQPSDRPPARSVEVLEFAWILESGNSDEYLEQAAIG
jgi:hypothetical protein